MSTGYALDAEYFEDFTIRRAKLPINIRLLLVDSLLARDLKRHKERLYNYKIRLLLKGAELSTNLIAIPKKVVIHQLVPPVFAVVIENKSIVQMASELFRIIWNSVPE